MTDLDKVVQKIKDKPYTLQMGANKLASWLKVSSRVVREAKKVIYKERLLAEKNTTPEKRSPKILILDIETAPLRAYVWQCWRQNIYLDQIVSNWYMLTWAAKWLFEPEIMSQRLFPDEARKEDDKRIVENLWHLLNEADVVIAHNGEKFDIPRVKTRFLFHGLPPTTFYQQVDTKKIAAKEFDFPSNKLAGLARFLGLEAVKLDTDFPLWPASMEGEEEALRYMEEYNRVDVSVLEEVYLMMRPYIKGHPNYNLYIDSEKPVCPHCGHDHLEFAGYYYFTPTGKYRNFRCMNPHCGALSRERKTVFKNSKSILVSNGR